MLTYGVRGKFIRVTTILVSLSLYPVVFMWIPLQSAGSLTIGRGTSDVQGTVFRAMQLSEMPTPWSRSYLLAAPEGEGFWNLTTLPSAFKWLALWISTRFLDPISAVNMWIVLAWVISGIGVYLVGRQLGASTIASIAAGIMGQSLPWLQEKAGSHTSLMLSGGVLICYYFALQLQDRRTNWTTGRWLMSLIALASLDPYLFSFGIIGSLTILLSSRLISARGVAVALIVFSILILARDRVAETISGVLLGQSLPGANRQLRIAEPSEVDFWTSSLTDYVRPHTDHLFLPMPWYRSIEIDFAQDFVNYSGLILLAIGAIGVYFSLRSGKRKAALAMLMVLILACLVSTVSYVELLNERIAGPASVASLFQPGLRVFSRWGLIAQFILASFSAVTLSKVMLGGRLRTGRYAFGALIVTIALLDLNPFGGRRYVDEVRVYEPLRGLAVDAPTLYLPASGAWYIDAVFSELPAVNGALTNDRAIQLESYIATHSQDFVCSMREIGAQNVLIRHEQATNAIDLISARKGIESNGLRIVGSWRVRGAYSGTESRLTLFRFVDEQDWGCDGSKA